ncbi:unnamed protein product [Chrysodeixis includens]|uniref:MADF domain-containing protein n=1 Tax=Chrysodeixis includens TaxID=689277 RepID=A0A9P0BW83_CHRIL|nr:unnamed protein product [Chrysodeixis includens]
MRDDYEYNIKFCELVARYPVIYNDDRVDYGNRYVQDKAWGAIAKNLKDSVTDCKERWKNLRNRYCKYQKAQAEASSTGLKTWLKITEYYLAPHLRFLDNYMQSRYLKSLQQNDDLSDSDDDTEDTIPSYHPPSREAMGLNIPLSTSSKSKPRHNSTDHTHYDYSNPKRAKIDEGKDEDLSFLHSLLGDVKAMAPSQKRQFKIKVMQLAQDILEGDSATTSGRSQATASYVPIYMKSLTKASSIQNM